MIKQVRVPLTIAALVALSACGVLKGGQKKTPVLGDRVPILATESDALPDKSLAGVQVVLPPAIANDAWAQPGGSASKSMGQLALGDSPAKAWSVQIPGGTKKMRLAASPVIAGGRLYVIDVNGTVHAMAADTGAETWKVAIAPDGKKNAGVRFGGGVSFDDGKLFATDGLGDAVALDAADGKVLWKAKPGGPLRGSPTIANGNVYVLSQDNQIFALSQTDGKVQWTASASLETQGVFGVGAPAAAQGTVIAGFSSGELNAYRYENGRSVWQDSLSRTSISTSVSSLADIDADPVIDQGRVYAVGQGGRMVALELLSGQRLWEQNFAGISTPWIAGEWLFVVTDDAKLICLSRANGKIRWISQLNQYENMKKKKNAVTWTGPLLAGNRLVLLNSMGQIVMASPEDGKVVQTIENKKASYELSPVVANNMLYVLDAAGRLTAYR